MIIEIPTAKAFARTSREHLNLAWDIGIELLQGHDESDVQDWDSKGQASKAYWTKSRPMIANALGLIQQSQEFALKGRIASTSPYLLLTRDPKDWPRKCDHDKIPFSEFRTIDAADLIKVHNTVAIKRLPSDFSDFFDSTRRQRNTIMHQGYHSLQLGISDLFLSVLRTYCFCSPLVNFRQIDFLTFERTGLLCCTLRIMQAMRYCMNLTAWFDCLPQKTQKLF